MLSGMYGLPVSGLEALAECAWGNARMHGSQKPVFFKPMKKSLLRTLLVLALVVSLGLVWWYFGRSSTSSSVVVPSPLPVQPSAPTLPITTPEGPIAAAPPEPFPAISAPPALEVPADPADANDLLIQVVVDLVGRKPIKELFQIDGLAQRVAATIDSLPRDHSSWIIWPVNRTAGRFTVVPGADGAEGTLSASNAARYTPFVQLVESVSTQKWVAFYQHVYPLLQQAYVNLGYPNASFNTRLLQVIDHLLEAPVLTSAPFLHLVEVRGPVASLQPWVRYEFVEPQWEAMSAGQKILVRTGAANHQRLRIKLTALRAALAVQAAGPQPSSRP